MAPASHLHATGGRKPAAPEPPSGGGDQTTGLLEHRRRHLPWWRRRVTPPARGSGRRHDTRSIAAPSGTVTPGAGGLLSLPGHRHPRPWRPSGRPAGAPREVVGGGGPLHLDVPAIDRGGGSAEARGASRSGARKTPRPSAPAGRRCASPTGVPRAPRHPFHRRIAPACYRLSVRPCPGLSSAAGQVVGGRGPLDIGRPGQQGGVRGDRPARVRPNLGHRIGELRRPASTTIR